MIREQFRRGNASSHLDCRRPVARRRAIGRGWTDGREPTRQSLAGLAKTLMEQAYGLIQQTDLSWSEIQRPSGSGAQTYEVEASSGSRSVFS